MHKVLNKTTFTICHNSGYERGWEPGAKKGLKAWNIPGWKIREIQKEELTNDPTFSIPSKTRFLPGCREQIFLLLFKQSEPAGITQEYFLTTIFFNCPNILACLKEEVANVQFFSRQTDSYVRCRCGFTVGIEKREWKLRRNQKEVMEQASHEHSHITGYLNGQYYSYLGKD